jgi:hypothetical protein
MSQSFYGEPRRRCQAYHAHIHAWPLWPRFCTGQHQALRISSRRELQGQEILREATRQLLAESVWRRCATHLSIESCTRVGGLDGAAYLA